MSIATRDLSAHFRYKIGTKKDYMEGKQMYKVATHYLSAHLRYQKKKKKNA